VRRVDWRAVHLAFMGALFGSTLAGFGLERGGHHASIPGMIPGALVPPLFVVLLCLVFPRREA